MTSSACADAPGKYDAKSDYTIRLDTLPLVPPFEGAVSLDGVFEELARLKVLSSIMGAHLKEESAEYTPEQVEELKKHYLSKNLYLNFPTTTEYTDLQQALADGSVDTRTSYKIDIGNRWIINLGKLHSANKFLDRMYELVDASGQKIDKPTFGSRDQLRCHREHIPILELPPGRGDCGGDGSLQVIPGAQQRYVGQRLDL